MILKFEYFNRINPYHHLISFLYSTYKLWLGHMIFCLKILIVYLVKIFFDQILLSKKVDLIL